MSQNLRPTRENTPENLPGIVAVLGELGAGALVSETGLAELLGCHRVSVQRAVKRGELPPPVRLMGRPTWTVGAIVRHVEARLAKAAEEADILSQNRA